MLPGLIPKFIILNFRSDINCYLILKTSEVRDEAI
jgi:hypothetical protein